MRLKKLLVNFLLIAPKSLNRTELVKYVYLFEYYYYQMYRHSYTGLEFKRDYFGPNQPSVIECAAELNEAGILNIIEYENYYGGISYSHELLTTSIDEFEINYSAREVVSFVVDVLGNQNYRGVIDITYSTPPMKEILDEERKKG